MKTYFSNETTDQVIIEHQYRVDALQKKIKELEDKNTKLVQLINNL